MNKILFLSLALFIAETVSAEEGLQPYLFFGNSGQTIEDTNESISTALSVSGFEVLGQYSLAESPERSVLVVSHPELGKTSQYQQKYNNLTSHYILKVL